MEEIKVYHSSSWKNYLSLLFTLVLLSMSVWLLTSSPQEINTGTIITAVTILATLVSTLYAIYPTLRERLTNQPYCIITDRSLIINDKNGIEIRFADVEKFHISKLNNKQILIRYKDNKSEPKKDGILGRLSNRFSDYIADTNEGINASGLTYEPQELCNLLNGKVEMA